jgi:hypothetical protein
MTQPLSLKTHLAFAFTAVFCCVMAVTPTHAQNAPAAAQGVLSADVSAAFARMGKALQAKEFSFRSHTTRAYTGPNGELLHISHTAKVVVRRPDRLLVESVGDDGATTMVYDGKNVVLYNVGQKKYVGIPATGSIETVLDVVAQRVGTDFPLADLLTTDPDKSVLAGVTSGGQVGTAMIDGVRCNHYFFIQMPDLDMELWLEDNAKSLPRRVFITYRSMPGRPTFMADLSEWNLSAHPADADFTFKPPAGVEQVALKPNPAAPAGTQK